MNIRALGCGPCGSSSGVVMPSTGSLRDQGPVDEDEFAVLMAFYSQARLAVELLEDQKAMGVEVNDETLTAARAMMVQTKKTLDEVGMLQAG